MQPSDVQALLDAVLVRTVVSPFLIFWLALAGSGVGAYLGSYLKKRGEDRASQENFAAIRAQLQTTTNDTEQIKQTLSGRAWRSQRAWAAREQYYGSLLTHLHLSRMALNDLSDYFIEPGTEHIPNSERGDHFSKLLKASSESFTEVEKLLGPATLFLSQEAVAELNNMIIRHWGLTNYEAICTADYVRSASVLVKAAYEQVLQEAKRQLSIDVSDV